VEEKKRSVRVRIPANAFLARFFFSGFGKFLLSFVALSAILCGGVFTYYYIQYSKLIDAKLKAGPFTTTSRIYAAPIVVGVGDAVTPDAIAAELRRAGYTESRSNPTGSYNLKPDEIEIFPGPEAYAREDAGVIHFADGRIARIVSLSDNTPRTEFNLEPRLITNLYDRNREKRRYVKYSEIPPVLREAVISAEDRRFFQHSGFDPIGIVRAVWVDLKEGRSAQGASTISQQLARGMWLSPARSFKRKAAEFMITLQLEQKLSKEQIFEMYSNEIDLGRRGSFTIRGFGEAAESYFGKDIRQLTPAEAATLAGMLRGASYYNPFRHPDRIRDRRNVVLALMRDNNFLTEREYALAVESPLKLSSAGAESSDAPYYVDLVNDELQSRFSDYDFQAGSYRIYTSLDLNLQRAANDAVQIGMRQVDELLRKSKITKEAQCALIALDPHTGEIKALVGGRSYGQSQLDHVTAKRQPGSIFKPFVYAAAMNTALAGGSRTLTPASTVEDVPTTFMFDGKPYEPGNFHGEFYGTTTLRRALAHSMNVATIKVAEMVGYNTVVSLAHKAGINEDVKATPAMALGAYEATPLEMAGAYTVFANGGVRVQPVFIDEVRGVNGGNMFRSKPQTKTVLDPRVNYLMVSMLEEVMRSGTAAGVRAKGFTVPAGGKTGTSHDGWFAGFTSQLLCIVWVGFDDNSELGLQGAHSALPVWTEFMKRALAFRGYRDAKPFSAPDGIVTLQIDSKTGMPATPYSENARPEVFIAGTEPVGVDPSVLPGGGVDTTNVAGWDTSAPAVPSSGPLPSRHFNPLPPASLDQQVSPDVTQNTNPSNAPQNGKKPGFFHRIFGGNKPKPQPPPPT
jgi:penicillin-binding protein 1B